MKITQSQLEEESLIFNNEHKPQAEAFEIELDFGQISTWDNPYKLFVNGQLKESFKTFTRFRQAAESLITIHDLQPAL